LYSACLIIGLLLYFFLNDEHNLTRSVIISMIVVSTLRSLIVAVRYATSQDQVYQDTFTRELSPEELSKDLLFDGWIAATPILLDEEIKASMARNEIENSIFRFSQFNKVDKVFEVKYTTFDYYEKTQMNIVEVMARAKFYIDVVSTLSDSLT